MAARHNFTERLLLFIADLSDLYWVSHSVGRAQRALSGDPRWRRDRRWMEQVIRDGRKRQQLHATLYALRKAGFLRRGTKAGKQGYLLTSKGAERVLRLQRRQSGRRRLSGGQWLMVFFDVPEVLRKRRDVLRRTLQALDFQLLQKSIWVSPYDVAAHVRRTIKHLALGRYVQMMAVRELPGRVRDPHPAALKNHVRSYNNI